MIIEHIRFEDHPILGTIELDFTDPATGVPFHTIILAGENGCGKTVILNEIYSILGENNLLSKSGIVEITVQLDSSNNKDMMEIIGDRNVVIKNNRVFFRRETVGKLDNHPHNIMVKFTNETQNNQLNQSIQLFQQRPEIRPFRVFYSEAAVGFNAEIPRNVTATELDLPKAARRSGTQLAAQIAQLLVDIRAADNEDLSVWLDQHPGVLIPQENREKRIGRFKDAIAYMFPNKRYKRNKTEDGAINIEFEENGAVSTLNHLSTGEKQIIFRGGFVLRDLNNILGGLILIDEPELSLHPEWQARILGFYRRLLPQVESKTTQLITATHSPFVVHGLVNAKVIILRKSLENGKVEVDPEPNYPTTGSARVVRALNADLLIERTEHEVVVLVEGTTDQTILEVAWDKLNPGVPRYFEIRPALSQQAIRITLTDDQVFKKNPGKKIIGLFDFDSAYDQWNRVWNKNGLVIETAVEKCLTRKHPSETAWSMLLPVPAHRSHLASTALGSDSALPIELLFQDSDFLRNMIKQVPLPAPNAYKPVVNDNLKTSFSRHVASLPQASFSAFKPIFEKIDHINETKESE